LAETNVAPSHRDAVISTLVYVHASVGEMNKRLLKQQGRQNYVTPRHYLDFINHFVRLINEKRDELEEQQLHLNIGNPLPIIFTHPSRSPKTP
jgi:dynein heavy chain 1